MQCAIGAWLMAAMSVGVFDIGYRYFDRLAPHRMPSQHNAAEGTKQFRRSGAVAFVPEFYPSI